MTNNNKLHLIILGIYSLILLGLWTAFAKHMSIWLGFGLFISTFPLYLCIVSFLLYQSEKNTKFKRLLLIIGILAASVAIHSLL